jgi:DNA-binding CsgD family transcriptional regulator
VSLNFYAAYVWTVFIMVLFPSGDFGNLFSRGLRVLAAERGTTLGAVKEDLSRTLKMSEHTIDDWRSSGRIPAFSILIEIVVFFAHNSKLLDRLWLAKFVECAGYQLSKALWVELFPTELAPDKHDDAHAPRSKDREAVTEGEIAPSREISHLSRWLKSELEREREARIQAEKRAVLAEARLAIYENAKSEKSVADYQEEKMNAEGFPFWTALTKREKEIFYLISGNEFVSLTNIQFAMRLNISTNTLRNHLRKLYLKTGTASRAELVKLSLAVKQSGRNF